MRRHTPPAGTELERDFTFISDIVKGVIASSRLAAPLEVFNLGNTHPEKVSTLIHLIEQGLGLTANITQAPISAGDVPRTFADVSHARALLAYEPQVSLAEGVRRFLQWYSGYYGVELPASMQPTRKEQASLLATYDIASITTLSKKGRHLKSQARMASKRRERVS